MSGLSDHSDMSTAQLDSGVDTVTVTTTGMVPYSRTYWTGGESTQSPWWRAHLAAVLFSFLLILGLIGAVSYFSDSEEEGVVDGVTTTDNLDLDLLNTTLPIGVGVARGSISQTNLVRSGRNATIHNGEQHKKDPVKVARTAGLIWPEPKHLKIGRAMLVMDPATFHLGSSLPWSPAAEEAGVSRAPPCPLLERAMQRYRERLLFGPCASLHSEDTDGSRARTKLRWKRRNRLLQASPVQTILEALVVDLTGRCEDTPHENMDESYRLVLAPLRPSKLTARSVWGILRGLESFSQLVRRYNATHFWTNESEVVDAPRFRHRGVLLDTSSHFIPVASILELLDLLAFNKMNVLHWRIVGDHSFPFVSEAFPVLSEKGAYDSDTHVYHPADVERILREASDRGIRIVPEFDTPGNTRSWGKAFPQVLSLCEEEDSKSHIAGLLDPTKNATFVLLEHLLLEVKRVFPDGYIHLGGNELNLDCWKLDMEIAKALVKMNISGHYDSLLRRYYKRLFTIVRKLHKSFIIWEDVFTSKVRIPEQAIVQIRRQDGGQLLHSVTSKGLRALVSHCWLPGERSSEGGWRALYRCEPHYFNGTSTQKALIIGGEVSFHGDAVDRTNLIARTW